MSTTRQKQRDLLRRNKKSKPKQTAYKPAASKPAKRAPGTGRSRAARDSNYQQALKNVGSYTEAQANAYDKNQAQAMQNFMGPPPAPQLPPPPPELPPPPRYGSRSPASAAPIHANPQAFGSAYAPQTQTPQLPEPVMPAGQTTQPAQPTRSFNPLMQSTFGYQTGEAPDQIAAQKAAQAPQYEGNDEPGKLGQADDPLKALGEMLKIKKKVTLSVSD